MCFVFATPNKVVVQSKEKSQIPICKKAGYPGI